MISQDIINTFDKLWGVETKGLNDQLREAVMRRVNECVRRGVLQSSMSGQMVVREAVNSIPARSQSSLNLFLRIAGAHQTVMTDEFKLSAQRFLTEKMKVQNTDLRILISSTAPFKNEIGKRYENQFLAEIDKKTEIEIQRICGELEIVAAAAKTRTTDTPSSQPMVFHGPVGLIQTGPGSYGVANQRLGTDGIEALEQALRDLTTALADRTLDVPFNANEVSSVVEDAKKELSTAQPNAAKIKGYVYSIGSAISYAPHLRKIYETLKWAGQLIGVSLP